MAESPPGIEGVEGEGVEETLVVLLASSWEAAAATSTAWRLAAVWEGGLAGTVSRAASAAGRRSAGMRMTLQRAASAPAARRPALQNWATCPVFPHLEQRRREASEWTTIRLSVQPSASTSETKAGSVNPRLAMSLGAGSRHSQA